MLQKCDDADQVLADATQAWNEMKGLLEAAQEEKRLREGPAQPPTTAAVEGQDILQKFQALTANGTGLEPSYVHAMCLELVKFPNLLVIMQAAAVASGAMPTVPAVSLQTASTPLQLVVASAEGAAARASPPEPMTPLAAVPLPVVSPSNESDEGAKRRARRRLAKEAHVASAVLEVGDDEDVEITQHTDNDGREV